MKPMYPAAAKRRESPASVHSRSRSVKLTEEESKRIVEINTDISDYIMEYLAEVTTGKKNLDETWDSYLSQLDSMGGAEYGQIYNDAYHRNK